MHGNKKKVAFLIAIAPIFKHMISRKKYHHGREFAKFPHCGITSEIIAKKTVS